MLDSLLDLSFNVTDDSRFGWFTRDCLFACIRFAYKLSSNGLGGCFFIFCAIGLSHHRHFAGYEKESAEAGIFCQILWQAFPAHFSPLLFLSYPCCPPGDLVDLDSISSKIYADLSKPGLVCGYIHLRFFL